MQSVGMNMKALYHPTVRMNMALRESKDEGQSRIEITYMASSKEAEQELLHQDFVERAKIDLNRVEDALNRVDGLGWHLSLIQLMERFVEAAKQSQLLIVQPSLVALVFAVNSQPGHFTGIIKGRPLTQRFNHLDFIAESAFGGQDAIVTCIMQSYSSFGPTHYIAIEKRTALS